MSENKEPLNKNNKVPKLRLAKYYGQPIIETNISKIAEINPKCKTLPENFFYIDLESVKDDRIVNYNFIQRNNAPSRAQRLLIKNDILFSGVRPYQHNNAVFLFENGKYVASTGFIQIRYKFPFFLLGYFSNDRFSRAVNIRSTGSSYPAINSYDLSRIKIFVPSEEEQSDISKLIIVINKKINNLESKISTLKKYKKGLSKIAIKDSVNNWIYKNESGTALGTFLREINEYSKKDNGFTHVTLSKDGIGNKSDRYDRDFLVKTEDKKYKITRFNQLCYNPANLKFGVICINKFGDGIFSPIYITYQIKGIDVDYLELLVTSDDFRNYSMKYQQGTVFERMSVSPEDLQKIKIVPACKERQLLLSVTVKAINKKMKHFEEKLSLLSSLKKILLNDLFI